MPFRIVGRKPKFEGKTIYEIVCNLKNFGVNRIIYRTAFRRYPEPSYYRIIKAEPDMDPDLKCGTIIAEVVFRGRNMGVQPLLTGGKSDYRLVPKDEEEAFCNRNIKPKIEERILPSTLPFPPLLKAMIVEEMKSKGIKSIEEPRMKSAFVKGHANLQRTAAEDETPVVLQKHVSWKLYDDVLEKPLK